MSSLVLYHDIAGGHLVLYIGIYLPVIIVLYYMTL